MNAAWLFDDANDVDFAKRARKKSIEALSVYVENTENIELAVVIVDMQRRIGDFEGAEVSAKQLIEFGVSGLLEKVLNFEIKLCSLRDDMCHNMAEVE